MIIATKILPSPSLSMSLSFRTLHCIRTIAAATTTKRSPTRNVNRMRISCVDSSLLFNFNHVSTTRSFVSVQKNDNHLQHAKDMKLNTKEEERKMLAQSTEIAIRAYMNQKYPRAFFIPSPSPFSITQDKDGEDNKQSPDSSASMANVDYIIRKQNLSLSKSIAAEIDTEMSLSLSTINTLATLNGYTKIPPSQMIPTKKVKLAEGVMATAHKNASFIQENYIFYSRPSNSKRKQTFQSKQRQQNYSKEHEHPPFIEEDFKFFKILERKVEERLRFWEEGIKTKREHVVQRGVDYVENIQDGVKSVANIVVRTIKRKENVKGQVKEENQVQHNQANDATTALSTDDDDVIDKQEEQNKEEDLIVVSRQTGELFLIENISPSFRLLILPIPATSTTTKTTKASPPYKLTNARSGRIVTTSLVLLGAIPLMYRSLVFTMDYPWLARVVAASVAGSVGYSLWSFSNGARSRQSGVICAAVSSRMVARDDALVCALKEEAMKMLVFEVLEIYHHVVSKEHERQQQSLRKRGKRSGEIDPVEVAAVLGLIQWQPSRSEMDKSGIETEHDIEINDETDDNGSWTALDISGAHDKLSRKTVEFTKGRIDENTSH